jgi:sugar lactone lactonase YvrE
MKGFTPPRITVVNPTGQIIARIKTGSHKISNVCFGGPGNDELFITAGEKIYILNMMVKGSLRN